MGSGATTACSSSGSIATRTARLKALLRAAGAPRLDPARVEAAFVHESAAREAKQGAGPPIRSNERLEFVGDAVLGFIVARMLYDKYPDAPEGELALRKSALVSDAVLAVTAERLGFGPLLKLGGGYAGGRSAPARSMLAGAFEAFVAALAHAAGLETAAAFVERQHVATVDEGALPAADPKTVLQEWTQAHRGSAPRYADRAEGPPHERVFTATVFVDGAPAGEGAGPSKKEAQRAAAARALEHLVAREEDVVPQKTAARLKSSATPPSKQHRP